MTGQGTSGDTNHTSRDDDETFETSAPTLLVARTLSSFGLGGPVEMFVDPTTQTVSVVSVVHYATSLPCLIELKFDPGDNALAVKVSARRNRGKVGRVHRPSSIHSYSSRYLARQAYVPALIAVSAGSEASGLYFVCLEMSQMRLVERFTIVDILGTSIH